MALYTYIINIRAPIYYYFIFPRFEKGCQNIIFVRCYDQSSNRRSHAFGVVTSLTFQFHLFIRIKCWLNNVKLKQIYICIRVGGYVYNVLIYTYIHITSHTNITFDSKPILSPSQAGKHKNVQEYCRSSQ